MASFASRSLLALTILMPAILYLAAPYISDAMWQARAYHVTVENFDSVLGDLASSRKLHPSEHQMLVQFTKSGESGEWPAVYIQRRLWALLSPSVVCVQIYDPSVPASGVHIYADGRAGAPRTKDGQTIASHLSAESAYVQENGVSVQDVVVSFMADISKVKIVARGCRKAVLPVLRPVAIVSCILGRGTGTDPGKDLDSSSLGSNAVLPPPAAASPTLQYPSAPLALLNCMLA